MTTRQLQTGLAVAIAIAVLAVFFIYNPFTTLEPNQAASTGSASLVVQDETVGTGATAQAGDVLTVNYTGKLANGTVFDSSVGKTPFQFTLGTGSVIPGWDQGLIGMKVGGKRILIIPPSLAYGPNDYGPIPGNSTLTFEIDLLNVAPASGTPAATQ